MASCTTLGESKRPLFVPCFALSHPYTGRSRGFSHRMAAHRVAAALRAAQSKPPSTPVLEAMHPHVTGAVRGVGAHVREHVILPRALLSVLSQILRGEEAGATSSAVADLVAHVGPPYPTVLGALDTGLRHLAAASNTTVPPEWRLAASAAARRAMATHPPNDVAAGLRALLPYLRSLSWVLWRAFTVVLVTDTRILATPMFASVRGGRAGTTDDPVVLFLVAVGGAEVRLVWPHVPAVGGGRRARGAVAPFLHRRQWDALHAPFPPTLLALPDAGAALHRVVAASTAGARAPLPFERPVPPARAATARAEREEAASKFLEAVEERRAAVRGNPMLDAVLESGGAPPLPATASSSSPWLRVVPPLSANALQPAVSRRSPPPPASSLAEGHASLTVTAVRIAHSRAHANHGRVKAMAISRLHHPPSLPLRGGALHHVDKHVRHT